MTSLKYASEWTRIVHSCREIFNIFIHVAFTFYERVLDLEYKLLERNVIYIPI